jgi:hypothetical protein
VSIVDWPYQESYPPSLFAPVVPATGATAVIPGTWTPPGSQPPASVAALQGGIPNVVTASPATPWTSGQYVQTRTGGAAGRASWTGTGWVGGAAPALAEVPEPEPEPEPQTGGGGVEYHDPEPPADPQRRRRSRS